MQFGQLIAKRAGGGPDGYCYSDTDQEHESAQQSFGPDLPNSGRRINRGRSRWPGWAGTAIGRCQFVLEPSEAVMATSDGRKFAGHLATGAMC